MRTELTRRESQIMEILRSRPEGFRVISGDDSLTLALIALGGEGLISVASNEIPAEVVKMVEAAERGDYLGARHVHSRILPLINFENRQCGLRACKTAMKEGGVIGSEAVRHPLEALHPATREGLLELAREVDPLVLRWGK